MMQFHPNYMYKTLTDIYAFGLEQIETVQKYTISIGNYTINTKTGQSKTK